MPRKKIRRKNRDAEPPSPSAASVRALLETLDETLDAKVVIDEDTTPETLILYHNVPRPSRTPCLPSNDPRYRFMLYVCGSPPPKP
jgi:hypothetical protein